MPYSTGNLGLNQMNVQVCLWELNILFQLLWLFRQVSSFLIILYLSNTKGDYLSTEIAPEFSLCFNKESSVVTEENDTSGI